MKIIEVIADQEFMDPVTNLAEQHGVLDYWLGPEARNGRRVLRLLVGPDNRQAVLDALQGLLGNHPSARMLVVPVETVLPRVEEETPAAGEKKDSAATTREELYAGIEKNARLNSNFLLLVFLSTIVVAIGLLADNVAVVIGAMVIAPLLGPNIALALGTALGDAGLMWKALKTTIAGMLLALGLSVLIGALWPLKLDSAELLARTDVGLDSIVLAMASGAAAVLSLTTGLPSVLVGVMVSVALLPPMATFGLMMGAGKMEPAVGAALLLAVNIVCVNLAAKIAFLIQGIKPRTWLEKQKARQSMVTYIILWVVSLTVLITVIYLRRGILLLP